MRNFARLIKELAAEGEDILSIPGKYGFIIS